jgi:hypothetical protein
MGRLLHVRIAWKHSGRWEVSLIPAKNKSVAILSQNVNLSILIPVWKKCETYASAEINNFWKKLQRIPSKYTNKSSMPSSNDQVYPFPRLVCIELTTGPVIEMFELEGTRERRLVIGYRQLTSTNLFSALSDLYHFYGLTSSRKYVEQFSNGITVIGIYLMPARNTVKFPPIESSIHQVLISRSLLT